MINRLLHDIEESDKDAAAASLQGAMGKEGEQAWAVHESLYPVAQQVQNPPYINPHWPKQYRIAREFLPYLKSEDIPSLVSLEVNEYTQKPKLPAIPRPATRAVSVSFPDIEEAIRAGQPQKVAAQMAAFMECEGGNELARRWLLLGSGYLDSSLGHSVSCTAFILLEMLERADKDDTWPALARLADYFCRGSFHTTPPLAGAGGVIDREHLLKATSGNGIVNLHHTITRYSIERVRHLLTEAEYHHMLSRWVEFIGDKPAQPFSMRASGGLVDYADFLPLFSQRDENAVLPHLAGLAASAGGRKLLGRFLIKGVCDKYPGSYDPHFLTGLGSALWVVETYSDDAPVALNALRQYVNYYFG